MADSRIGILIDTLFRGRGLQEAQAGLKGLNQTAGATTGGLRSLNDGLRVIEGSFVAAGAAGLVFKKSFDFAEEGARLQLLESQFERLATSIGSSGDAILSKLSEVSRGTMTNAEMMRSASQIISLGLADNEEDVVRLASLVTNLGWDMNQVIMTFANDSKMRLDALGLSVEDVTRRAREFEAAGHDASEAFDLAVLAAGEEKLRLLGSAADSSVGAYMRFRAGVQENIDKGKEWLATGLTPIVMLLNDDYGDAIDAAVTKNLAFAESFRELGRAQYIQALVEELARLKEQGEGAGAWLTGTQDEMIQGQIELTRAIAASSVSFEDFKDNIQGVVATGGIKQIGSDTEELTLIYTTFNGRVVENAEAFYLAAKAGSTLGNAYDYLIDRSIELTNQQATSTQVAGSAYDYMIDRSIQLNSTMEAYGEHLTNASQKQEELGRSAAIMEQVAERQRELAATAGEYFVAAMNAERGTGFWDQALEDLGRQQVLVGGRTRQQNEDLEALRDAYNRATGQLHEYEIGLRGAGMTEEERAEAMGKLSEEAARLQGLMQPLIDITGTYAERTVAATINTDAVNAALMRAVETAGAAPEKIAALGVALGEYSPEAAEAALQSAAIQAKIDALAEAYAGGKIKVGEMRTELMNFIADLTAVSEPAGATAEAVGRIGRNMDDLKGATDRAADAINNFPKKVEVDFVYNAPDLPDLPGGYGGPGSTGGGQNAGQGGTGGGGVGGARGLDFIVPPGFANDSYGPIWAQSGEHVKVTPAGQGGAGANPSYQVILMPGAVVVNGTPGMNEQLLANLTVAELGRRIRLEEEAGVGYIGR